MATNWPNSVQTFTNPTSGSALNSPSHADQHTTVNDTVEALQNYAGLVLVKSVTVGSGVSSVAVTSAFDSRFDTYKIVMTGGVASISNPNVNMTLTGSTTTYYWATNIRLWSGSTITQQLANGSYWQVGGSSLTTHAVNIDVSNPYLAKHTVFSGMCIFPQTSGGSAYVGGIHATSSSYTGFTLSANAGTLTGGTIRVYGYNNGA